MTPGYHLSDARLLWAIAGSVPAVICDLRQRRIPNSVCAALFAGGLLMSTLELGLKGFGTGLLGAVAGFAVFLVFYLLGGMGGGDIKLMAAYGAFLGFHGILLASLITALAGAAVALGFVAVALVQGRRPKAIPYAPAIAFGALIVLIGGSK
jgi:prepilin peptidase CpaA